MNIADAIAELRAKHETRIMPQSGREKVRVATYVGSVCLRGHEPIRYVASKVCVECQREWNAKMRARGYR